MENGQDWSKLCDCEQLGCDRGVLGRLGQAAAPAPPSCPSSATQPCTQAGITHSCGQHHAQGTVPCAPPLSSRARTRAAGVGPRKRAAADILQRPQKVAIAAAGQPGEFVRAEVSTYCEPVSTSCELARRAASRQYKVGPHASNPTAVHPAPPACGSHALHTCACPASPPHKTCRTAAATPPAAAGSAMR